MIKPYFFCELCKNKHELNGKVNCLYNLDQNDWANFMMFEKCPACESSHFYLQKDFNKILGCGIIIVGIIFVPMTYGLSLAVVALIDWLLYNQVPDSIVCYKCKGEFFGIKGIPKKILPFDHHIAELYEEPS